MMQPDKDGRPTTSTATSQSEMENAANPEKPLDSEAGSNVPRMDLIGHFKKMDNSRGYVRRQLLY